MEIFGIIIGLFILCILTRITFDLAVLVLPVAVFILLAGGVIVGLVVALRNTVAVYRRVFFKRNT